MLRRPHHPAAMPMTVRTTLCASLLALALGCSPMAAYSEGAECQTNRDCGGQMVCFLNGCGDPGKDLVVEVVVNARNGHLEQDFAGQDLNLEGNTPIYAAPPMAFNVTVLRPLTPGGEAVPYADRVTLRAEGASDKLPGVQRRYSATMAPLNGVVTLPTGSGDFVVTTLPDLLSIPPIRLPARHVAPGQTQDLRVVLPHPDELYRVDGQLLRSAVGPVLINAEAGMQVRALDPQTLEPLSQGIPVSITTGHFRLLVDKSVNESGSFLIEASPRDSAALIPTKRFLVSVSDNVTGPLELGDYGVPVTVSGTLVSSDNSRIERDGGVYQSAPVSGATVYIDGMVAGGGTFRSASVTTGTDGRFALSVLPSGPSVPLTLHATPPAGHFAHSVEKAIQVKPGSPGSPVDLGTFVCGDRVSVSGVVLTPSGAPAIDAEVRAVAVSTINGQSLTAALPGSVTAKTNAAGRFTMWLEGARYRVDVSATGYPFLSNFIDVEEKGGVLGTSPETPPEREFILSASRKAKGTVRWTDPVRGELPAPYATLRLFRVGTISGLPFTFQIGEAISDPNGNYTLLVPTR